MADVNIKVLGCVDVNEVEEICIENDIDICIDFETDTIVQCNDERFLAGVLAALMFSL